MRAMTTRTREPIDDTVDVAPACVAEVPADYKRTTATVDRLLHHAHLVLAEGGSHRLSEAVAGKGVKPLN